MAPAAACCPWWRLPALVCLLWPLLGANLARAETWALRVSSEGGVARDLVGASPHAFFGVAADAPLLARRLEVGAGARVLLGGLEPQPALAGFLSGRLCTHQGWWSPALGLELELSTAHVARLPREPPESFTRDFNSAGRGSLLRAHLAMEPLRFEWDRFLVTALALRVGTPLDGAAGQRVRLSLTLLRLGWTVSS
jgi:hypothetical protein